MDKLFKETATTMNSESKAYNVSPKERVILVLVPVLTTVFFTLAWFIPETYFIARWASKENGPAETLTFLFLLFGAIIGVTLAARIKSKGGPPIVWGFLALFSLVLFLIGMEEISWGQQLFKFETPESLMAINEQNELNLHNIQGLQGHSEYFHLIFGLAGLISIYFNLYLLNAIRVPRVLATLFFTITVISIYDLASDYFLSGYPTINYFTRRLSEVNEMLIGVAGFAYVLLLARKYRSKSDSATDTESRADFPLKEHSRGEKPRSMMSKVSQH